MTTEAKPLRVGVIGSPLSAVFMLERLTLRRDFQTVALWPDESSARSSLIDHLACKGHSQPRGVIDDPRVDVVYFTTVSDGDLVGEALRAGKAVVLSSPLTLPVHELRCLATAATEQCRLATFHEPSCWDHDFLLVQAALDSHRLGDARRVRLSIHERGLPGESFSRGILRDLGSRWFTQLLMLVDAAPRRFDLRRFPEPAESVETGFLAIIDFQDGASSVVEIQTGSLLAYRTGWMIEGTTGAYRSGRFHSQTADGEIIDEPLPSPTVSSDPFLDALALALRGEPDLLPSLHDAARVVDLIDRLEQSSR